MTIGKFDGVHQGHRAVIDRIRSIAENDGLKAVVVTFDRNPLALLAPEKCPDSLVSVRQKLELLATTGVDATLLLPFDRALASKGGAAWRRRRSWRAVRASACSRAIGAHLRAQERSGLRSNVTTTAADRARGQGDAAITARCPACTPSNLPMVTADGPKPAGTPGG